MTESTLAAVAHAAVEGAAAGGPAAVIAAATAPIAALAPATAPAIAAVAAPAGKNKFSMTEAVAFVAQASTLGLNEQAQSLVARNESGELSTEECRTQLMSAMAAKATEKPGLTTTAGNGSGLVSGGTGEPEPINIGAVYQARGEAVKTAARATHAGLR